MPRRIASRGARKSTALPVDADLAGGPLPCTGDEACELGLAAADEPGDAEDFAFAQFERHLVHVSLLGEVAGGEDDAFAGAGAEAWASVPRGARRPAMDPSRLFPTIAVTTSAGFEFAVFRSAAFTPSRSTVTASQSEKSSSMRCEMYRSVTPCSDRDRRTVKSRSTSGMGNVDGGFVQQEDPCVLVQGLGEFHCLLFCGGVAADGAAYVQVEAHPVQGGPCLGLHPLPVHGRTAAQGQLAEENVLGHGQGRHEGEFLVNGVDTGPLGVRRIPEMLELATKANAS